MLIKAISTSKAPQAIGPYSQAVLAGGFLFISGQLPTDPVTGKIEGAGVEEQMRQVLKNIGAILEEAGLTFEQVVRSEIFLQDMKDFKAVNALYAEFFHYPVKPARQTIQAAALPMGALVEISCIALNAK